jgi:hypothetical protein
MNTPHMYWIGLTDSAEEVVEASAGFPSCSDVRGAQE